MIVRRRDWMLRRLLGGGQVLAFVTALRKAPYDPQLMRPLAGPHLDRETEYLMRRWLAGQDSYLLGS